MSTEAITTEQRVQQKLSEAGVFAGMHGLEGLLHATEFWEQQQYGTRLYYGHGGLDYLHHGVLAAAVKIIREQPSAAEIEALRERADSLQNLLGEWLQWFGSTNDISTRTRNALEQAP